VVAVHDDHAVGGLTDQRVDERHRSGACPVGSRCDAAGVGKVFLGSEALANGAVTRHELQRWYRRIYPDVYVGRDCTPSLPDRAYGAWLRSRRRAVIAGAAASALNGAPWVDADVPIELIYCNGRPPAGLVVRNETLADDEVKSIARLPVTTPVRSAFDLGRHLPRDEAVARLDALMWSTRFAVEDVVLLAKRYPKARGLTALRGALSLVDGGSDSPMETWLRLLVVDAGFPSPTTQITVVGDRGDVIAYIDMGWEDLKIALEYDGDHHRSNRRQYVRDQRRIRSLEAMGWIVIRVIAEDNVRDVVARIEAAFRRRGATRD
jgi:hypothetical protein